MLLLLWPLAPFLSAWLLTCCPPLAQQIRGREDVTVPAGLAAVLALLGTLAGWWALPLWACVAITPLTGLAMVIDADPFEQ